MFQNRCAAIQAGRAVSDLWIRHGETEQPEQWQQNQNLAEYYRDLGRIYKEEVLRSNQVKDIEGWLGHFRIYIYFLLL